MGYREGRTRRSRVRIQECNYFIAFLARLRRRSATFAPSASGLVRSGPPPAPPATIFIIPEYVLPFGLFFRLEGIRTWYGVRCTTAVVLPVRYVQSVRYKSKLPVQFRTVPPAGGTTLITSPVPTPCRLSRPAFSSPPRTCRRTISLRHACCTTAPPTRSSARSTQVRTLVGGEFYGIAGRMPQLALQTRPSITRTN